MKKKERKLLVKYLRDDLAEELELLADDLEGTRENVVCSCHHTAEEVANSPSPFTERDLTEEDEAQLIQEGREPSRMPDVYAPWLVEQKKKGSKEGITPEQVLARTHDIIENNKVEKE